MTGNDGNNTLFGLAGNDQLIGGAGHDTVDGGVGNDVVVMQVTAGNVDNADGGVGTDTLALVGAVDGDGVVVDLSSVTDQVTSHRRRSILSRWYRRTSRIWMRRGWAGQ